MNNSKIFKLKAGKIAKAAAGYAWRYIRRKPLVFNLNLNVTNICNQNCPMCNAVITGRKGGVSVSLRECVEIYEKLKPYSIASLTISGGEPSLVKDIPQILDFFSDKFPFGVNVNSNLYANEKTITPFAESALKNNIRIGTSFDGLSKTADKLRGAKNVSQKVIKNIELVTRLKKDLKSNSTLNMNSVICDQNLDQIPEILSISEKFGWTHTLAPWNCFFYQDEKNPDLQTLHYSDKLEKVIALAASKKNIACSREFLLSIPKFVKDETDKYCPYLTGIFRTYKIFVDPNGDVSLCSREPIGNIRQSSLEDILKTEDYRSDLRGYRKCHKCWMACFVEVLLAMPKFYQKRIVNRY
ncbi:MAG: radical SAM protein [Spirochaetota bacterium]